MAAGPCHHRVGVVVPEKEIPPVDVVDVTVAVIIDTVARDLAGVGEDRQIGVVGLYAVVDDGDNDRRITDLDIPGVGQPGVRTRGSAALPGVDQMPLVGEQRVIWGAGPLPVLDEVGLGPDDPVLVFLKKRRHHQGVIRSWIPELDEILPWLSEGADHVQPNREPILDFLFPKR